MANFWGLRRISIFSVSYAYVDHKDYLADSLFNANGVSPHFGKEMARAGSDYRVIFCKIRKKEAEAFKTALQSLENKMILCGHPDYSKFCDELTASIGNSKGDNHETDIRNAG